MIKHLPSPFVLFLLALSLSGCGNKSSEAENQSEPTHDYQAHGTIERISADRHIATIHHQSIPGYMMEMTMDFPVRDDHLLDGMGPGDQIDFTLRVTSEDAWVEAAHRTGHSDIALTNGMAATAETTPPSFKVGDELPDAAFLAEDGRQVHLSDFRGKVVILTFFFTRCPLPNYCPLMNRNFAATRDLLLADPHGPTNWEFLSISFDPEFDQPQTLASYADFYRHHNNDRWLFVSAPPDTLGHFAAPLGLVLMRQDNNISHNLRTVVIDPQGRLFHQFNDNLWTSRQLADTVADAAKSGSQP
jgi:protein SCO1/2